MFDKSVVYIDFLCFLFSLLGKFLNKKSEKYIDFTIGLFYIILMIYGFIFTKHLKYSAQNQRNGIENFIKKHNLSLDKFVSFDENPDISILKPGDSVICYSWDCLCTERSFLRKIIQFLLKHKIYIYSATSKYCLDKSTDINALAYGVNMYDDIWNTFISYKNILGAKTRVANGKSAGRPIGAKNIKHVLDGKENLVLDMYNHGFSMYAIANKLNTSAPTIKRFLVSQK